MKTLCLILCCFAFQIGGGIATAARPNVLVILTDDQGYGDLSSHGSPHLKTPSMDRIGREGVRLDRFYVSPVCAPTRASLLTGRYHLRTGVYGVTRREEVMDPAEVTVAELLQAGGYATGAFGKWHNGSVYPETPNGPGFDEFLGVLGGLSQRYFDPVLNHNGEDKPYPGYITEILTDAAIDWMGEQVQAEQPFFCYVPYNAPHTPGLVEERHWKPFYDAQVGRWESVIFGMIEVVDEQVGRMLEFLDKTGQAENTIVIFMSDNGPATWRYNAGLRGKKSHVYEGGIRVPCFVRWPERLTPHTLDYPLSQVDLLPTLAEWCGLAPTESLELDGRSFAHQLEHPDVPVQDRVLISFGFGSDSRVRTTGAVHTPRWTAVQDRGKWELYDIVADVRQRHDLASVHPDVVRELKGHFVETLATMPPNLGPKPVPLRDNGVARVVLEGQDAILPTRFKGKGIDFNFPSGFSHQWISYWTNPEAVPEWNVEVFDAGEFAVSLFYCLPEADVGVEAKVEIQGQSLPVKITEAFDPPSNPQPFWLDGEAVKYESKAWRELPLGQVTLVPGSTQLKIEVTHLPGQAAMEVKEIVLRRL